MFPVRIDTNITKNIVAIALFEKISFSVNYSAGDNGIVTGELVQTVRYSEDALTVTAIPNKGYMFVK